MLRIKYFFYFCKIKKKKPKKSSVMNMKKEFFLLQINVQTDYLHLEKVKESLNWCGLSN